MDERVRGECSGLPHGGVIFGLFISIIIIVSGVIFLLQETGVIVEGFDVFGQS